jgi:hypothetical protein
MKRTGFAIVAMALVFSLQATALQAEDGVKSILVDLTHTERWNRFADKLIELHKQLISETEVRTTEKTGGYYRRPDYYKEVRYFDKKNGRLLSKVQWETEHPELVHSMEVYIYDQQGRVTRDYLVSYLVEGRAAPMQALINFHAYNGELHAFRQFDASNNRTYEHCEGSDNGKVIDISLGESDILQLEDLPKSVMTSPTYKKCFKGVVTTARDYLTPRR